MSAREKHTNANDLNLGLEPKFPEQFPELALLGEAVSHLSDISVALHSVAFDLEQIRRELEDSSAPVQSDAPVATYTPIYTRRGTMTSPEFESWFGGSR